MRFILALLLLIAFPAFAAAPPPLTLLSSSAGLDNENAIAQYANTINYYYAGLAASNVTSVSVVTANGVSGSVTATTTPAITLTLGAITPSSVASTGAVSGTTLTGTGLTTSAGTIGGGATFTVASGCGTGGSIPITLTGGSATGSFVTATTTCSPVITLPTAPHGWWCQAWDETTSTTTFKNTANSATSCTLTESTSVGSGDTIVFHAEGF